MNLPDISQQNMKFYYEYLWKIGYHWVTVLKLILTSNCFVIKTDKHKNPETAVDQRNCKLWRIQR